MAKATRKIEIDEQTATTLEKRALERGISVRELVAELSHLADVSAEYSPSDLAELDRRWAEIERGGETIPHEEVLRWLKTWGTPDYKAWDKREA